MQKYIEELGEFNEVCSKQLFSNLAKLGISPWWTPAETMKGSIKFLWYDPLHTCVRALPNSPRHFQISLRNGLISQAEADLLTGYLAELIVKFFPKYRGYFAQELATGLIGKIAQHGPDTHYFNWHEAHQNFIPDDVYAQLPWPILSPFFDLGRFTPARVALPDFVETAQYPLRAIAAAVDIVNNGPSIHLGVERILGILNHLLGRGEPTEELNSRRTKHRAQKVIIPAFSCGFQGIVLGIFVNLTPELETFVLNQLQQLSVTMGEKYASLRAHQSLEQLRQAKDLNSIADSLLLLMPPLESILFLRNGESVGYTIHTEGTYLAGYEKLRHDKATAAVTDPECESIEVDLLGQRTTILVKALRSFEGFDQVLTLFRVRSYIDSVLSQLDQEHEVRPLFRDLIQQVHADLEQQIHEERGAIAACKRLFLVDLVLRQYQKGEALISNAMCREFMEKRVGGNSGGYHVSGRAGPKYEADIHRLLPNHFTFEPLSKQTVRVRWRPLDSMMLAAKGRLESV